MERRKRYAVTLFVISLVTVLVLGAGGAAEDGGDSCQMAERFNGEMVNIKKAKENAVTYKGMVSVPKGLTVNSSEDCEQGCCGNANCTVYLFYPRPPSNDESKKFNCFFLNCRPQNLCSLAMVNVSNKAEGSVVGIRDLQPGNTAEVKEGVNLESVPSVKPKSDLENATTVKPPNADVSAETKSSTPETKNMTSTTEKPSNVSTSAGTEALTTTMPMRATGNAKDDKNHTTYASLIIALGFGTLFLFAALVLIGRPWWYAFHRPRYSKVDYLMNGL